MFQKKCFKNIRWKLKIICLPVLLSFILIYFLCYNDIQNLLSHVKNSDDNISKINENLGKKKEVFQVPGGYIHKITEAESICNKYDAQLATINQMYSAQSSIKFKLNFNLNWFFHILYKKMCFFRFFFFIFLF